MPGQQCDHLVACPVQLLTDGRHPLVEEPALAAEQPVVGDLLDEGVLERDHATRFRLGEEAVCDQLGDGAGDVGYLVSGGHQPGGRHLAPDDRADEQTVRRWTRQAVDPGREAFDRGREVVDPSVGPDVRAW